MEYSADMEKNDKFTLPEEFFSHNISIGMAYIKYDGDFKLISANDYFFKMFETSIEDYADGILSQFGKTDKLMYYNYLKNQIMSDEPVIFEFKTVKKNSDRIIWVKVEAKLFNKNDKIYFAVFSDITKEKNLSSEINEMKNLYLKAISSSDEIIFDYQVKSDVFIYYKLVEENGNIINKPMVRSDFLKNLSFSKDLYPDDLVYFYDLCRDSINHPFDIRFRRSKQNPGEYTQMRVHATTQKDSGAVIRIIGTVRPIEIVKEKDDPYDKLSETDELTGLYSKNKAKSFIEDYLLNSTVAVPYALLILDVKNFKQVNDSFGHLFGDDVLVQVADCIIENIGRKDIVGRLGGDEFIIFIKNTSRSAVESICDKICRSIRNIYVGEDISIDTCIGAVVSKDPSHCYTELLCTADNELFELIINHEVGYKISDIIINSTNNMLKRSYIADCNIRSSKDTKEKRLSELIFELLEQAKDMDKAMDTVLGLIGEKKNLSRITIMKRINNEMLVTRQWFSRAAKENISINGGTFIDYQNKMQNNFSEDGMGVITLETAKRYNPDKAREILLSGAKSIMYCNMMEFGEVVGVIAFVDCEKEREWTDIDYKAYRTITRMISAYTIKTEVFNKNQV